MAIMIKMKIIIVRALKINLKNIATVKNKIK